MTHACSPTLAGPKDGGPTTHQQPDTQNPSENNLGVQHVTVCRTTAQTKTTSGEQTKRPQQHNGASPELAAKMQELNVVIASHGRTPEPPPIQRTVPATVAPMSPKTAQTPLPPLNACVDRFQKLACTTAPQKLTHMAATMQLSQLVTAQPTNELNIARTALVRCIQQNCGGNVDRRCMHVLRPFSLESNNLTQRYDVYFNRPHGPQNVSTDVADRDQMPPQLTALRCRWHLHIGNPLRLTAQRAFNSTASLGATL